MRARAGHVGNEQVEKARLLIQLHARHEILELHNVWDVTSTRAIAAQPHTSAIATASAAVAASHGYEDGEQIPWSQHLACIERICTATDLPVSVDIERGYDDPVGTALDVIDAGAVGVNLEDACSPPAEFARILTAVRDAARHRGLQLVINARTDEFLLAPRPNLERAIEAAHTYLDAGADCVFIPGMIDVAHIQTVVADIGPQRLSLLHLPDLPSKPDLEHMGVTRLSHGPALHNATATFIGNWTPLTVTPPSINVSG